MAQYPQSRGGQGMRKAVTEVLAQRLHPLGWEASPQLGCGVWAPQGESQALMSLPLRAVDRTPRCRARGPESSFRPGCHCDNNRESPYEVWAEWGETGRGSAFSAGVLRVLRKERSDYSQPAACPRILSQPGAFIGPFSP